MVKLTQIDDETQAQFEEKPASTSIVDSEEESESESDDEFDDDYDFENETIYDRIVALKDIIAPEQREQLVSVTETIKSTVNATLNNGGKFLWTLTSSALLLGVPLALAILSETQLQEMEKDLSLQQSAQDVLAPGSEAAFSEKK
ncbi:uncharacterized protein SPAPADRAFT_52901 [Spathaspora passalidarum NRRL Y-27907]|uniref:Uncharacterized protein n=1 Tax=Spathaspora passalidarum (strain NRRL Y-27907 / 11-Y1) TaxID=619300 RepID=G3AUX4_SPAPN|nr:uncharacterized protein SPAPADRAFT_52901 [Spathaspora passalidarum NRRL Y-27907]EGW30066.1 hypothetical protein SPAPADRAFT_52901 [Spathaspora passalidarum NRRL Y-27907]